MGAERVVYSVCRFSVVWRCHQTHLKLELAAGHRARVGPSSASAFQGSPHTCPAPTLRPDRLAHRPQAPCVSRPGALDGEVTPAGVTVLSTASFLLRGHATRTQGSGSEGREGQQRHGCQFKMHFRYRQEILPLRSPRGCVLNVMGGTPQGSLGLWRRRRAEWGAGMTGSWEGKHLGSCWNGPPLHTSAPLEGSPCGEGSLGDKVWPAVTRVAGK